MKILIRIIIAIVVIGAIGLLVFRKVNTNLDHEIGDVIDTLDGVFVYYNGPVGHTGERVLGENKYNIGLKFQCVEFIKRYYYERFNHRMPDTYGNAKDFFNASCQHGELNRQRGLLQFENGGDEKPKKGDIIVFQKTFFNKYGHVAIISDVTKGHIQITQQNAGPFGKPRKWLKMEEKEGNWFVNMENTLGWLRLKK